QTRVRQHHRHRVPLIAGSFDGFPQRGGKIGEIFKGPRPFPGAGHRPAAQGDGLELPAEHTQTERCVGHWKSRCRRSAASFVRADMAVRAPAATRLPMTDTTLSLSMLGGQLKAVALRRGTVTGTWERPGTLEDFANFSSTLREAIEGTGYQGDSVSVVLAHSRL